MSSDDSASSAPENSSLVNTALRDLDLAEEHILDLLQIAQSTAAELGKLPFCDTQHLTNLATRYKELVPMIQARLQPHAGFAGASTQVGDADKNSPHRKVVDYGVILDAEVAAQLQQLDK